MRRTVVGVALLALGLGSGRDVRAQDPPSAAQTLEASPAGPGPDLSSIETVAFLAGCWAGGSGTLDMREQWSEPEGGAMLGTTRYFREGALVDFEFAMLVEAEEGVTLWPYPGGERSEHGFPLVAATDEYVFENLAHDFPVRIVYRRLGDDWLAPRIEGRDGEGPGWELRRVACPG